MNKSTQPLKPADPKTVVVNFRKMLEENKRDQPDIKLRQTYAKNLIQIVVAVHPKVKDQLDDIYAEYFMSEARCRSKVDAMLRDAMRPDKVGRK